MALRGGTAAPPPRQRYDAFHPGKPSGWLDTEGNTIDAHGVSPS